MKRRVRKRTIVRKHVRRKPSGGLTTVRKHVRHYIGQEEYKKRLHRILNNFSDITASIYYTREVFGEYIDYLREHGSEDPDSWFIDEHYYQPLRRKLRRWATGEELKYYLDGLVSDDVIRTVRREARKVYDKWFKPYKTYKEFHENLDGFSREIAYGEVLELPEKLKEEIDRDMRKLGESFNI